MAERLSGGILISDFKLRLTYSQSDLYTYPYSVRGPPISALKVRQKMMAKKRRRSSIGNLERAIKSIKISQPTTPDHETPTACNARVDNSSVEMQDVQRLPDPSFSPQTDAEMTTTNRNLSAAEELENDRDEMEISEPTTQKSVIPKTCKAGVVVNRSENYSIKIESVKVPEPGPDEILVKIKISRVCFADIHCLKGKPGLVHNANNGVKSAGHEGVGVVVKLGSHLKNIKIGTRVGIGLIWCDNRRRTTSWSESRESMILTGVDVPGTFQQYITLPLASMIRIPDGVSDETTALSSIYRAFMMQAYCEGDWALIAGGTAMQNILAAQVANAKKLKPIVLADCNQEHLCLEMGVEHFVDEKSGWFDKVLELTGGDDQFTLFPLCARGLDGDNYPPNKPGSRWTTAPHLLDNPCYMWRTGGWEAYNRWDYLDKPPIYDMVLTTLEYTGAVLEFAAKKLITPKCIMRPFSELAEAIRDVESQEVQECVLLDFST